MKGCFIHPSALFFMVLLLVAHMEAPARADGAFPENTGVSVFTGNWQVSRHADKTYQAVERALGGKLSRWDYYYQLKIVNQFAPTFRNCGDKDQARRFFNKIFGVTSTSMVKLTASLKYKLGAGQAPAWPTEAPLILVGRGVDPTSGKASEGCFFLATPNAELNFIRYDGAAQSQDYEEFVMNFRVQSGRTLKINAISTLLTLFSQFNAAFNWTDLSGARATIVQKNSEKFDEALSEAGTFQIAYQQDITMETNGSETSRLVITVPQLVHASVGNLVIYVRKVGSIGLDTVDDEITPDRILGDSRLTFAQCKITKILDGKCILDREEFAESFVDAYNKAAGNDAKKHIPFTVFDLADPAKRSLVKETCSSLRRHATSALQLSTADALAVRWATAARSGLLEVLKAPVAAEALAKENNTTAEQLQKICWSDDDEKKFKTIVSKLGKTARY